MSLTAAQGQRVLDHALDEIFARVRIAVDRRSVLIDEESLPVSGSADVDPALAAYIYGKFHTRSNAAEHEPGRVRSDPRLESMIVRATPRTMTSVRLPLIETCADPSGVFARYFGLRVFIPSERCLQIGVDSVLAKVQTVLPYMSMGYFHYTGQAGSGTSTSLLRVYYASDSPEAAVDAWKSLLDLADGEMIPFRAKILSRSFEYPRSDAIVVYLPPEAWRWTESIGRVLSAGSTTDLRSVFTRALGEGVAASWEPQLSTDTPRRRSFGEHRSHAVARGFSDAVRYGFDLVDAVRSSLIGSGVDPLSVHRNIDSPPFDLGARSHNREMAGLGS